MIQAGTIITVESNNVESKGKPAFLEVHQRKMSLAGESKTTSPLMGGT